MLDSKQAFSGYSVDNLQAAKTFYSSILELTISETNGMLFVWVGPQGGKVLLYPKTDHKPASYTVLNFPVDDIDQAVQELADKGIELVRYEGMPQDERGIMRGRKVGRGPDVGWFLDPAGNILSVIQD